MSRIASTLITNKLWTPLVYVDDTEWGFLIQSGVASPIELAKGWHWHWPLLTVIRLVSRSSFVYTIGGSVSVATTVLGDEPVIAATKDVKLVSLQADLRLRVNDRAEMIAIARLDKHAVSRTIRPTIRQGMRQVVALRHGVGLAASTELDEEMFKVLSPMLLSHSIVLESLHVTSVEPYTGQKR